MSAGGSARPERARRSWSSSASACPQPCAAKTPRCSGACATRRIDSLGELRVSDLQTPTSRSTSTTLIVCDDDTTLIRLRHYLERGGVRARATRLLQDAWREAPRCAA